MPLAKPLTRWRACWGWATPVARRSKLPPAAVILIVLRFRRAYLATRGWVSPYDFDFSGLKTAVLREVERWRQQGEELPVADLAASFQATVCRVLVAWRALRGRPWPQRCRGGGGRCLCNAALRERFNGQPAARPGFALGPLGLVHR